VYNSTLLCFFCLIIFSIVSDTPESIVELERMLNQRGVLVVSPCTTDNFFLGLDRSQMRVLVSVRYQMATFFEDLLSRLIDKVRVNVDSLSDDLVGKILSVLEHNLLEERGMQLGDKEGEYQRPHFEDRKCLLEALGYDYEQWRAGLGFIDFFGETLHFLVRSLLVRYKELIDGNWMRGLAGMYVYERRIPVDYKLLHSALEHAFVRELMGMDQPGQPLYHLASHVRGDVWHADELAGALVFALRSGRGSYDNVDQGVIEARDAWDQFWIDLLVYVRSLSL
jgi:hypothetical protein